MTKTKIGNYAFPSKVKHDPQEEGKGSPECFTLTLTPGYSE